MAKVDVSLTRTLTINMGNYESAKPTVTLTAKDVDASKVDDAYLALAEVAAGMFKLEVLNISLEQAQLKKSGLQAYCKTVATNKTEIGAQIEKSLCDLENL
jgi:hypothetical protein